MIGALQRPLQDNVSLLVLHPLVLLPTLSIKAPLHLPMSPQRLCEPGDHCPWPCVFSVLPLLPLLPCPVPEPPFLLGPCLDFRPRMCFFCHHLLAGFQQRPLVLTPPLLPRIPLLARVPASQAVFTDFLARAGPASPYADCKNGLEASAPVTSPETPVSSQTGGPCFGLRSQPCFPT